MDTLRVLCAAFLVLRAALLAMVSIPGGCFVPGVRSSNGWCRETPPPRPSPSRGEGADGSPGMGSRHGTNPTALKDMRGGYPKHD